MYEVSILRVGLYERRVIEYTPTIIYQWNWRKVAEFPSKKRANKYIDSLGRKSKNWRYDYREVEQ